ncbi:hypothetical protein [Marinobacter sp.]|uniref:hypothetical protein n=1 Tax=Marinobacter sp. TaxID=50741 RepID=UPI00356ACB89
MDTLLGVIVGYRCSALLSSTLNPDLALASGISPRRKQLVLSIALAIVVAFLFAGLNAANALSWRASNQSTSDQQVS